MENGQIMVAGQEDIAALELLVNSAYRGDAARQGWTHESDLLDGQRIDAEEVAAILENANNTLLKYTKNGQILGCVCLERKGDHMYLGMLTTNPAYQGLGIGKALLQAGESHAAKLGCTVVEMTVITDRAELMAWYERHGYRNTGKLKPFPSDNPKVGKPLKNLEFVVLEKAI
jgi:ribosomal protein S18 acetylase RimI-like enzyme